MVSTVYGEKCPQERVAGMGQAVRWEAGKAGLKHREAVDLVVQASRQLSQTIQQYEANGNLLPRLQRVTGGTKVQGRDGAIIR